MLLLSATPYKPFTQAGDDEDHYEDFLATIGFLCRQDKDRVAEVEGALRRYRQALVTGGDAASAAMQAQTLLLNMMSRSERPQKVEGRDQVVVRHLPVDVPSTKDLADWVELSQLGDLIGSPVSLEYWKSVPYFVNFMDGYRIEAHLRAAIESGQAPQVQRVLSRHRSFSRADIKGYEHIEPGHPVLQALSDETLGKGWWKLLWMPPSMPYIKPGPIFAPFHDGKMTKHVMFSKWSATPTAVSVLLSHEAERLMRNGSTTLTSQRLGYRQVDDDGSSMSTLTLFWPHPELVTYCDQLEEVRAEGDTLDALRLVERVHARLPDGEVSAQAWQAFFAHPAALSPDLTDIEFALQEDGSQGNIGLRANIERADKQAGEHEGKGLSHPDLAWIAAFAPGSVAYRAVCAIAGASASKRGMWRAAYTIAEGFRTLFNRPEAQGLLDQLYPHEGDTRHYWQRVLRYCADGNLRAVLDEYLFQLWCDIGQQEAGDDELMGFARTAVQALTLHTSTYHGREATVERADIAVPTRFAVRYGGGARTTNEHASAVARQKAVRTAFNSPFAPFLLASTSVGQEGIDFHWWSHSVIHWNLPSNPVDFEQREGRVNRYGGLAVRKNVADRHWHDVLRSQDSCAWRVAFRAAEKTDTGAGAFSPWWVYPGPAQIQRVLAHYPMSRDIETYDRLRSSLTLYRLTLGQPRQEDMVEMLQRRNVDSDDVPTINLTPPSFDKNGSVADTAL